MKSFCCRNNSARQARQYRAVTMSLLPTGLKSRFNHNTVPKYITVSTLSFRKVCRYFGSNIQEDEAPKLGFSLPEPIRITENSAVMDELKNPPQTMCLVSGLIYELHLE
ncbi:hypothetical protein F2P81_000268 [Scophthalmus maximus]|uniref:Uncharacterized protein n=1 Tax=Scophthalmus maximus TaxID=52904 RepID=A0A6A4TMU2_SCOMX|nr:hypothetical protein F2P81_000268 [Scophthalmus maximus]